MNERPPEFREDAQWNILQEYLKRFAVKERFKKHDIKTKVYRLLNQISAHALIKRLKE